MCKYILGIRLLNIVRMYDVQPQLQNSSSTSATIAHLLRLESMPYLCRNRVPICAVIDDLFQHYTR